MTTVSGSCGMHLWFWILYVVLRVPLGVLEVCRPIRLGVRLLLLCLYGSSTIQCRRRSRHQCLVGVLV
jgi:hypothetical protein